MIPTIVNSKLVGLLGLVALVLLLILGGEVFYANLQRQQLLETSQVDSKKTTQETMPSANLTERDEESFADLVERPLFIEGRKPVPETSISAAGASAVSVKFDWVLNGIYTTPKGLAVFLTRAAKQPKDNYRKIHLEDELDGWKLTKILSDRVIFTQASSDKELMLRKPKLKQLPSKKDGKPQGAPIASEPEEQPQASDPESESPEDTLETNDEEQF